MARARSSQSDRNQRAPLPNDDNEGRADRLANKEPARPHPPRGKTIEDMTGRKSKRRRPLRTARVPPLDRDAVSPPRCDEHLDVRRPSLYTEALLPPIA